MKILLFQAYIKTRGGAERTIMEYAKRSKHDVDIYTLAYLPEQTFQEFKKLNVHVIKSNPLAEKVVNSFFARGFFYSYVLPSIKLPVEDYDAMLVSLSGLGEFIAIRNRIPQRTFMYCHSPLRAACAQYDIKWMQRKLTGIKRYAYDLARACYSIGEKLAWKHFNRVFFNSNLTKERAINKGLIAEEKTDVIYPGVDLPKINHTEAGDYLIYVSRFTDMKRQRELLKAWQRFYRKYKPDFKLVLVGALEKQEYWKEVVRLAEKTPAVALYPNVSSEDLHNLYKNARAGLFLGYYEDFGIVPFEVLAYGKPLIAVDSGGFWDLAKKAPAVIPIKEEFDFNKFMSHIYHALIHFWLNEQFYLERAKQNASFVHSLNLTWDRFAKELDRKIGDEW